jgi:hypothetical protein
MATNDETRTTKLCQTCRACPAVKKVMTLDRRGFRWKCQACLSKEQVSGFTKAKLNPPASEA